MLSIKIGLITIPVMTCNYVNSRYSVSQMHQFSVCCSARVRQKKVCEKCGIELKANDIRKGLNEKTILTNEQADTLKEYLEGGYIEVLSVQDYEEINLVNLIPIIQKTQLILPSISKGFKKNNIKVFYSFVSAIKELNKFCICKLTQRSLEHLGILAVKGEDLLFIELPFKNYQNLEDITRLKSAVENIISVEEIKELEGFKEEAKNFINSFNNKVERIDLVVEDKKVLLSKMLEEIKNGVVNEIKEVEVVNPFKI